MKALAVTLTAIFQWFIAFAVGLIFLALEARATPIQWSVQDGGNDHYYDLVGNHDTNQIWSWQDSKVLAEDSTYLGMTGHLVTINGAAENQFIINTFYSNYTLPMWLGLTDSPDYGGSNPIGQPNPLADGWVWVTGEPVTVTGWGSAGTGDTYGYGS